VLIKYIFPAYSYHNIMLPEISPHALFSVEDIVCLLPHVHVQGVK
jgi:hypothetical protein